MAASCNSYYGHNAVLARYVGLSRPRPMLGYLLHGWHPWFPWMPDLEVIRASVPRGLPVFAWSERDLEALRGGGIDNAVAIGAPFLYLLRMRGVPPRPDGHSLITFPFHTITDAGFEDAWSDYAHYLESVDGFDRITVCLYHVDYDQPRIRSYFEDRGFATATAGSRDDPSFLDRFYDLVARHTAVTSNRISTALIYGAALARSASLGGPVPAVTEQQTAGHIADEGVLTERFQREHFSPLLAGLDAGEAERFGRAQLGEESMRSEQELKRILGWRGARQVGARAVAIAAAIRRRRIHGARV